MERKVQNPHKTVPTVHGGGVHPAALLEPSRRTGTFSGDILATHHTAWELQGLIPMQQLGKPALCCASTRILGKAPVR